MKKKKFKIIDKFQNIFVSQSNFKKISKNFSRLFTRLEQDINDPKKTLYVLNKDFRFNFNNKDFKKFKSFKTIAIIGMGGSILGTEAIHDFLKFKIKKKIYFFDDINIDKINDIKKKENLKKTLFLIISKSGSTIETITNFLSLNILKKNSRNIIIISEKNDNILHSMIKKFNLFFIEHKKFIGGRFSVLSEVGIIPSILLGINIFRLRQNLFKYMKGKEKLILKDNSIKLASLLLEKKVTNLILLNYLPELEKFLSWCQQLIAESLGKKSKGFLPVISNAPKDHHSMLQLYLDGPKDKVINIFSHSTKSKYFLNTKNISKNLHFLHKKEINQIKISQKEALIKVLKKKRIPFREFKIRNINEETIGQLFSYFIVETILIGKLMKINPFDQPAVEQVKIYTKKNLLKNTKYNF